MSGGGGILRVPETRADECRIKFTLRTFDGRIIASATTDPIRITDDHKTDTKTKVVGGATTQAAVPRRKGRQSAASSRLQSPVPSEGESVQSVSEAGAMLQRQTPHARAGKPYERPPSQSPAMGLVTGGLPPPTPAAPAAPEMPAMPTYHRQHSSGSIHSVASMSALPVQSQDDRWSRASSTDFPDIAGTVSPNALRRPNFSFTALNGVNQFSASAPQSASSSNVASPVAGFHPLNDDALYLGDPNQSPVSLVSAFAGLNALNLQQVQPQQQTQTQQHSAPMLFDNADVDMSSAMSSGLDGLFDTSSQTSFASSVGGASAFLDNRSLASYSQSGLPPDSGMENFLDYSGGEEMANLAHPFPSTISPPGGAAIPPLPFDMDPLAVSDSPSAALQELLASMSQPSPNAPVITHVIPAEGPVAGGITVAVAGQRFTPGVVVMFGSRVAKTTFVAEGFVQCTLPPAIQAGDVEVTVQGAVRFDAAQTFKYTGMDKEM